MENTKIPLLIGVTGHRDLQFPDIVYEKSLNIFRHLQAKYPHTPICVMSALAEGADQICAEAALDSGAEVWCIIPFEERLYLSRFNSQSGVERYQALKARASRVIEIGADPSSQEKYVAAGRFIVEHSMLLLAAWDGCKSEDPGGTWSVIDFALNKYKYIPDVLPADDTATLMIHLFSERERKSNDLVLKTLPRTGEVFVGKSPDAMSDFTFDNKNHFIHELIIPLEEFNRVPQIQKKTLNIPEHLEKEYELSQWLERYSKSSKLAQQFQNKYNRQLTILFCGGVSGGLCIQIYGGIDLTVYPWGQHFIGLYLLLWACMYCYWLFTHKLFHIKYLEQRLMTQYLKTYIYTRLLGCDEGFQKKCCVCEISSGAFTANAVKYWSLLSDKNIDNFDANRELVQKIWIEAQIKYLSQKIVSSEKSSVRRKIIQYSLTFFAITVSLFFAAGFYLSATGKIYDFLCTINGLLVALPLFSLAMFLVWHQQKNTEKTIKQYSDMLKNFQYIKICFASDCREELNEKVIAIGNASIKETLSWVEAYMDSHPEVIKS